MPEKTAKILEAGGNGGTLVAFFAALSVWSGTAVDWFNDNYMAVIAICTIFTTGVGIYGTLVRARLTKTLRRRAEDTSVSSRRKNS